ncbi:MAG: A/G-specific adenine glycosylase [Methanoregulaceae archaeon]|jgi:A/G-specific adenine glycosylase
MLIANEGVNANTISKFQKIILDYYKKFGRDLGWRHTTNPYNILVSEIMLQQTQVERVIKKYPKFISEFPSFSCLAEAPLLKVLTVWQGMGYNRRIIALQKCAQQVIKEFDGHLPSNIEILETFPGIGHSTACSIATFAFNLPVVFIETNIRRVFIYFFFGDRTSVSDHEILPLVDQTLDKKNPRIWYWALMDFGSVLKKEIVNPNRRSAHYTRQSQFENSNRELRGRVLRIIVQKTKLKETDIISQIPRERERIKKIISELVKEGFLIRDHSTLKIRET